MIQIHLSFPLQAAAERERQRGRGPDGDQVAVGPRVAERGQPEGRDRQRLLRRRDHPQPPEGQPHPWRKRLTGELMATLNTTKSLYHLPDRYI